MQAHSVIPGFWQYLGAFTGYTLAAIGMIYAGFFYLKQNPRMLALLTKNPLAFKHLSQAGKVKSEFALSIETALPLEARKTLYIIRSGNERFLIASSPDGTQFLSRLEANVADLTDPQTILSGNDKALVAQTAPTHSQSSNGSSDMRQALESSFSSYLNLAGLSNLPKLRR